MYVQSVPNGSVRTCWATVAPLSVSWSNSMKISISAKQLSSTHPESKARVFGKLEDFEMPPRQGLLASTFSNLFGTGNDPDSIGTFHASSFWR